MNVREKFNSYASSYDFFSRFIEPVFGKDKRRILNSLKGKILEVGVGTGASLRYYDFKNIEYYGIDISDNMLYEAKKKFKNIPEKVNLQIGNIEKLNFPSDHFDIVVSCDVFCTISNPIRGFKEIRRVLRKDGRYIAFEHVKSKNRILGKIMDLINLIVSSKIATNINRKLVEHMKKAGLKIILDRNIHLDIIKFIIAEK